MKYKEVIQDFASGKLNKKDWQVIFDNDGGYWVYVGNQLSEDEGQQEAEKMALRYGEPDGYRDVVELARAAGIPADWC